MTVIAIETSSQAGTASLGLELNVCRNLEVLTLRCEIMPLLVSLLDVRCCRSEGAFSRRRPYNS